MPVSQAIIASINGQGAGGGGGSKSASWNGIWYEPISEGQQQTIEIVYNNWDNSTIYWQLSGAGNNPANGADFDNSYGSFNPGSGSGTYQFYFTPLSDRTTEGDQGYAVSIGTSGYGSVDIADNQGPYTIRDRSKDPAITMDLDPASYNVSNPTALPDSSPSQANPGNIVGAPTYSSTKGGIFQLNGTNQFIEVPSYLNTFSFGEMSGSIWFYADSSNTGTQTLLSKELVFKVRINNDGKIGMLASNSGGSWTVNSNTSGSEGFEYDTWNNITFVISSDDAIRVYLNGVEAGNFSNIGALGTNTFPFNIGSYSNNDGASDYLKGYVGEVVLYNYGRTAQQVHDYYMATVERYVPQIPAFDLSWNVQANDFVDSIGSVTAILNSSTATGVSNYGGGLTMPGTSGDYIEIQGVNYFDTTFTLSFAASLTTDGSSQVHTLFDGSSKDGLGSDVLGTIFGDRIRAGVQSQFADITGYDTTDQNGSTVAWWDFVYDNRYVTIYKNGVQVSYGVLTEANTGWHKNLRIAADYTYPARVMPGTFYRIKYQKTALTSDAIVQQYNENADYYELPTIPLSMSFNGSTSYVDISGTIGDWALGDNYTIEWWQKPSTTGWGTIMSASNNDADVHNCIDIATFNGAVYASRQGWGQGGLPPNIWNHIAVVNDNGMQKLYFNGVLEYKYNAGSNSSYSATDTYPTLRLGRFVRDSYPQYFNGKITGVRICDRVLYTGNTLHNTYFVPEINPSWAGNNKLIMTSLDGFMDNSGFIWSGANISTTSTESGGITYLKFARGITYEGILVGIQAGDRVSATVNSQPSDSTVAADPFDDGNYIIVPVLTSWWSTTNNATSVVVEHIARTVTNNNVGVSTDIPHAITGTIGDSNGYSFGSAAYSTGNGSYSVVQTIPRGAAITSNIPNFGIRTVTDVGQDQNGMWAISYDPTGLSGTTSYSDVFNYYW
jgi:hypothetical protein